MKRLLPAAMLAVLVLFNAPVNVGAQDARTSNAQLALQWLQCSEQQANGQIGSGGNPIARSSEVALGLAAAGQPATAMRAGSVSLADYLKTVVTADVGSNGELLLARVSQPDAGPTATVAAQLQASRSVTGPTAGEYGTDIFSDAVAILGLRAAGQPVASDAIAFLKSQQKSDGGWSFDNADAYGTDSNTTAQVIQALISTGVATTDVSISNGFGYLKTVFGQGGFGSAPGSGPDANSDELAIQAIVAANRQSDTAWASMLSQALTYLADQQIASGTDAGAIANSYSKLFATTYAPAAFLLRPLTHTGISDSRLSLLACPLPAVATATPPAAHPTAASTGQQPPQLAQTGAPAGNKETLLGLAILILGAGILWRPARRARSS
jgi:hypothetical protein